MILMTVFLLATGGCAATTPPPDQAHPSDLVMSMLEQDMNQMDANLDRLNRQLSDLQGLPKTADPTLREIQGLDLAGLQLRQQQWQYQREHFKFVQEQLRRAKIHPEDKPMLLEQWTKHEQDYEKTLEDYRNKRHVLEEKRHQVEAQVFERYLH